MIFLSSSDFHPGYKTSPLNFLLNEARMKLLALLLSKALHLKIGFIWCIGNG